MHPLGYTGAGGFLELEVCVDNAPLLEGPVQRAIDVWNLRLPETQNCQGCLRIDDPVPALGKWHAEGVAIHELGHCAFGLQHVNRRWDEGDDGFWELSHWTMSAEALAITDGGDTVRGSGTTSTRERSAIQPSPSHGTAGMTTTQ